MKNSLKMLIGLSLFSILSFFVYYFFFTIKINFKNQTGQRLEKVQIGNKYIGTIEKDDETGFIRFLNFKFDGSLPNEKVKAVCNNKLITKNMCDFYFCGTDKHKEYSGSFQMAIKAVKNGNTIELFGLEIEK